MTSNIVRAEIRLPTNELLKDLPFYTDTLGMKLDMIFPADDPRVATLTGHGLTIRIEKGASESPGTIRILTDDPDGFADGERQLTAPNGTQIEIDRLTPIVEQPTTVHQFAVRRLRDEAPWVIGRAGMNYRDLLPSRLGGAIICSHIRVPGGGEVPDMVHYHTVGFQLIYCYRGWVDVLYEDQGDDVMRLHAGDCVIQPPEIRHRVCHASEDIEVIEIGVPAEHITTIDHSFSLPNGFGNPEREWHGQKFVHHVLHNATWQPFRIDGFSCRDTGINAGTRGVASIQIARYTGGTAPVTQHDSDILFTFVLEGEMVLEAEGYDASPLQAGDAFTVPPGLRTQYTACSGNLELLEAALPGEFNTVQSDLL